VNFGNGYVMITAS